MRKRLSGLMKMTFLITLCASAAAGPSACSGTPAPAASGSAAASSAVSSAPEGGRSKAPSGPAAPGASSAAASASLQSGKGASSYAPPPKAESAASSGKALDSYKNHPANIGRDYAFDGKISEKVLKNYLSRAMVLSFLDCPSQISGDDERMILETGVKYVGRACIPWHMYGEDSETISRWKEKIASLHQKDPEVIVEACIFETAWTTINDIPVPARAFEAFGLPVQSRNFRYGDMLYPNGRYINHWGEGGSVPDITRTETQLWFYSRAVELIDAGFEGLHFGQVLLMGENDRAGGYPSWKKVFDKVRAYAKTRARRHMVLINAHTAGMKDASGKLFYDFVCYPLRLKPVSGSVSHEPSADNPQKTDIQAGYMDSIYLKTLGGVTPSGYAVERLPFFVELDNYGPPPAENLNKVGIAMWPWGYDEISWFVNQPAAYRAQWLRETYALVQSVDPQGFLEMPGSRPAFFYDKLSPDKGSTAWYYANKTYYFKDEETIRQIFIADNQ